MKYFKIGVILGIIAILLSLQIMFFEFTIDDSLIGFVYAENLADGNGLTWNTGEKVESVTNFLWTILEAGIIKTGFNIEKGVKIMGIIFSILSVLLLYFISAEFFEKKDKNWALLPMVFFGLTPGVAFWAVSGLGTLLFIFVLLLALFFFIKEEKQNWPFISGLFFGILALTRPEGILFFGISFLYRAYQVYTKEIKLNRFIKWTLLFLIIYVPYFIWRFNYFGYLFANTYYAKKLLLGGVGYIFNFLSYTTPFLIFAGITLSKPNKLKIYLFGGFIILFIAIINLLPISGPYFRFSLGAFPFLYILATLGIKDVTEKIDNKKIMVIILLFILIFFLLNPFTLKKMRVYASQHMDGQNQLIELGKWLKENIAPGSLLVTDFAGALPYYSKLPTLDMWGVVNEHIAHNGISKDYVLSQNPDVFVFSNIFEIPEIESRQGMKDLNLLYQDENFLKEYKLIKEWPYGSSALYVYEKK